MRFTAISAAALAFAASTLAQTAGFDAITSPGKDVDVPAGETFTIEWQPGTYDGTVTLSLLGGQTPETLQVLSAFAEGVENTDGSYAWGVDSSLGDKATYGIKITLDSDPTIFQYSFPFHIAAGAKGAISASSSSSSGYAVSSYSATGSASFSATTTVVLSTSSASVYPTSSFVVTASTVTSSSTFPTITASGNLSTTATVGATTLTSLTSVTASHTSSSTSSTPSTIPTNAAPRAAAGSLALLGGIAAAIFAL
ncbi:Ser-Thr-rich glycosyl-phosphatidyl-inositol-anchored membrane family-domain-containing protein [Xylariales sp. AK1849]|nr:Ser-Thr-rich glycosyl-phosphatidyl-inositol-anchored membrane family-domain-containing protein [Xylariales sp. AK1849]